ncbi:DUF202 domain-containing protein [Pseudonocardiaceae bacterium YIM PH 21723]|nr:DUF202 domain-containing protein [Pseudonocardiaceae bacterium YIM PH 21723]
MTKNRWPGVVYGTGTEPDARFSFANERTFLAWIRTALALIATGVAIELVGGHLPDDVRRLLAAGLVLLGGITAVAAFLRWMRAERAMRRGEPLPGPKLAPLLAAGLCLLAIVLALVLVLP